MVFDITAADVILQENYDNGTIVDLVTQRHPLLSAISKGDWDGGDIMTINVQTGNPQNVQSGSANYSTSNISAPTQYRFNVSTSQHYNHFDVSRELIKASESGSASFEKGLDYAVRSCLKELGRDLARQMHGTSDNTLAQNTSGTSSPITVSSRDAKRFEEGMRFMADPASDGGTLRTGVGTVTGVNYTTGVITFTGTITSLGASDYLFREGQVTSAQGTGLVGMTEWLGETGALFGVTRTTHSRLQGQTFSASTEGLSTEDAFIKAVIDIDEEGGFCDLIVTDHETYRKIQTSQQSDKRYAAASDTAAQLGFKEVKMVEGAMVVPDRFAIAGTALCLSLESWNLYARGDLIEFVNEDGHILERNGSDGFRGYVASYCQLVCDAPIHNVRITGL
tara:strand:- start:1738 stop:2919 length:1182 start_codon:yes stop_codon:yes gene_type:complete